MPYRDNLYQKENIIGYTGDPLNNPTVYFKKENKNEDGSVKSVTYGHITQDHGLYFNIGREEAGVAETYEIKNDGKLNEQGKKTAQEYADGVMFHPSRNPFTDVSKNKGMKEYLSDSIDRYTEIKQRYISKYARDQVKEIIKNPNKKEQLHQLIKLDSEVKQIALDLKDFHSKRGLTEEKLKRKYKQVDVLEDQARRLVGSNYYGIKEQIQKEQQILQKKKQEQLKKQQKLLEQSQSKTKKKSLATFSEPLNMPSSLADKMHLEQAKKQSSTKGTNVSQEQGTKKQTFKAKR